MNDKYYKFIPGWLSDNEAETMKDVVDYLNGEFIDPNSFMDARIVKP